MEVLEKALRQAQPGDWILTFVYVGIVLTIFIDVFSKEVQSKLNLSRGNYLTIIFITSIPLGFLMGAGVSSVWVWLSKFAPEKLTTLWETHAVLGWVACFVAMDLAGYFYHRLGHETAIGWAGHRVHHLGEHYNTTLVARQPWIVLQGFITFPVVALLGFSLETAGVCAAISLLYQALQHTEHPWNLGWFRHALITAQTHQRHHSTDGMKGNYGFVFSAWDRLFGTWNVSPLPSGTTYGVGEREPLSVFEAQFGEWRTVLARYREGFKYPYQRGFRGSFGATKKLKLPRGLGTRVGTLSDGEPTKLSRRATQKWGLGKRRVLFWAVVVTFSVFSFWPTDYGSVRVVVVDGVPTQQYVALRVTTSSQLKRVLHEHSPLKDLFVRWHTLSGEPTQELAYAVKTTIARLVGKSAASGVGDEVQISVPRNEMGGSVGLVHALALLDSEGGGGLSAGLKIGATGTVDSSGWVGMVGGVGEKNTRSS